MGTRTISITDGAYHCLASEKRPGESFTDVILRLTQKHSLSELATVVSKQEAAALARALEENTELRKRRRVARLERSS